MQIQIDINPAELMQVVNLLDYECSGCFSFNDFLKSFNEYLKDENRLRMHYNDIVLTFRQCLSQAQKKYSDYEVHLKQLSVMGFV